MKTVLKNKILVLFSVLVMLLCAVFGVGSYAMTKTSKAKADDVTGTPTLTIESNNVSYADSIYILYAVSNDGFDRTNYEIKMLFWEELQEEYTVGTEKYAVTSNQSATVKGKKCLIFYSDGLAAKEMTTDIFARACVEIDGVAYYSDVMKFSVLEYVHTMREKGGLTTNQQNLFNNLLNYGASAQYQFNHNVDRIANGDYYSITIINGKLPDGFAHGRYKNKQKIKVKAEKAPHGMKFSHWVDEKGIIVSYDEHIEIELKGNKTYEAVYKDISSVATQLVLNAEIPYDSDVSEVELPTAVSFEVNGETVVLEVTWNTENFKTEQIGTQSLYATLVDQSAYDRYNIARDGIVMNVKTMPYTFEIDQTTGEYILTGYYGQDTEITLPTSYRNTFITTIKSKAFNQAKTLTKVEIPNTYKKIENAAFFLCDNIEEITVPFVGEMATSYNNYYFGYIFGATSYSTQYTILPLALRTVNIAEGATRVPEYAFYGCLEIENFNLSSTISSIGYNAFSGCKKLTEFTIPDTLNSLGDSAFYDTGLTRVNVSSIDKLFAIGKSPFRSGVDLYVKGKLVTEVTIPAGITTINDVLSNCTTITKVIIPDGVTSIGNYAFLNCSSLTEIIIPDSVTRIGNSAFSGCSSLTEIEVPDGVTSIGSYVFGYCRSLTSVNIPDGVTSIGQSAFSGCSSLTEIIIPDGVTSIDRTAFYECSSLTNVVIPDSVTSIGEFAFYRCGNMHNVHFPSGLTSIANSTFEDCDKLTEIVIPEAVYDIGSRAFYGCDNLAKVTILSKRLTTIGAQAFSGCAKLWEIYNLSDLEFTIGETNFGGIAQYAKVIRTSLEETARVETDENGFVTYKDGEEVVLLGYGGDGGAIAIPDGVTSIGAKAFYYCRSLTEIIIPDTVTSIGESAFSSCENLTGIVIPENVTFIDKWAFRNCTGLTEIQYNAIECADVGVGADNYIFLYAGNKSAGVRVIIGANVKKIPANMFSPNGSNFKSINVIAVDFEENSVCESIGSNAFAYCHTLTSVVIGDSVTSIGKSAFYSCSSLVEVVNKSTHITVSKGSDDNGYVGYYALAVYNSGDTFTGTKLSNDNGYIIYTDGEEKIFVEYTGTETDLILPSYITKINDYAFYNKSLTSIVIPDSVTSIGNFAFYQCGLESVVIGDSVTSIGAYAFAYSYDLTEIIIPDSVTSIGDYAFYYCRSLTEIIIPDSVTSIGDSAFHSCTSLTSVVIPDSVTSIGYAAFYYCTSLTSVVIPNSVTSIGDYAFYYCSSLTEIIIPDSVTSIGSHAFYNCNSLTSVVIPDSVTSIGNSAFYNCSSLTSVVIGDSVTSIGNSAFYGCSSLTSVVIGSGVKGIYYSAFYNCSNLTEVYYNGTAEEWAAVFIDSRNTPLTNATKYYYSESEPTTEGNYWHYDTDGITPIIWVCATEE